MRKGIGRGVERRGGKKESGRGRGGGDRGLALGEEAGERERGEGGGEVRDRRKSGREREGRGENRW